MAATNKYGWRDLGRGRRRYGPITDAVPVVKIEPAPESEPAPAPKPKAKPGPKPKAAPVVIEPMTDE